MNKLKCPLVGDGIISAAFWYAYEKNYEYESAETEIADEECDE